MTKAALMSLTALCLVAASPAFAQNANQQQNQPNSKQYQSTSKESVRTQLTDSLKQAGFTNVTVAPDSFLVRAKDKSGNPVTMFIDQNSVTEITGIEQTGDKNQTANKNQTSDSGKFANVPPSDEFTSKAVGLDVYDHSNQDIGKIKDIAIKNNQVKAYIVGVGGFLGVGERYVAVNPMALKLPYDHTDQTWRAELDTTKQELQSAPEFKYPSNAM